MPATKWQRGYMYARANVPWRRLMPQRTVRRRVQGVELELPWSHLLPDFAKLNPIYGQNLVQLAAALERRLPDSERPLRVLDVGANIGDSAAQLLAATDARVLSVEGDPYWIRFLERNVGTDGRTVIEAALLETVDDDASHSHAVRSARGTTHFVPGEAVGGAAQLSVQALHDRHADFARLRLVKSDTDGFDATLVPAIARTWAEAGPVLFFEYDPPLIRREGGDPDALWLALRDLGYEHLLVWDNQGFPLGRLPLAGIEEATGTLGNPKQFGYHFWDVAACRSDDPSALDAFDELVTEPFSPWGTRRN